MNISPVPTPAIDEMLPLPMMFLYGCLKHGIVDIDRENKIINISNMPYDPVLIDMYITQLDQYESEYRNGLNVKGIEISTNEEKLFNSIRQIYSEIKSSI